MICAAEWDVALLQECPPRWEPGFSRECGGGLLPLHDLPQLARAAELEDRPRLARPDRLLRGRLEPDPLAARGRRTIEDPKDVAIQARRPERRTMAFARLACGLCVTSLHASTSPPRAEGELLFAAEKAIEWAGGDAPLVFCGDFNVRAQPERRLRTSSSASFGLSGLTAPTTRSTTSWSATSPTLRRRGPGPRPREMRRARRHGALRLSDHAPGRANRPRLGSRHGRRDHAARPSRAGSRRPKRRPPSRASRRSARPSRRASRSRASASRMSSTTPSSAAE